MMPSPARASFAAIALVALCGAFAAPPFPAVSPAPSLSAAPAASLAPLAAASAKPAPATSAAPSSALETPYYRIETDAITTKENGDFAMPDKVSFSRPGSDGTADRAEGNQKRGTATLVGNVVLHDNGNAPEAAGDDEYEKGGPSTLTCDRLDIDAKAKVYHAAGHVHYVQGTRKADADRGTLDRGTGMLRLEGNVDTTDGASTLRAQTVDYNTITKKVDVAGGPDKPLVIKQPVPTAEPGSVKATPAPKKRRIPLPF